MFTIGGRDLALRTRTQAGFSFGPSCIFRHCLPFSEEIEKFLDPQTGLAEGARMVLHIIIVGNDDHRLPSPAGFLKNRHNALIGLFPGMGKNANHTGGAGRAQTGKFIFSVVDDKNTLDVPAGDPQRNALAKQCLPGGLKTLIKLLLEEMKNLVSFNRCTIFAFP